MTEYRFITYELLDEGTIARITLDRAGYRNAQNRTLLVELDHAFLAAEADDTVRVVILAGAGEVFSAGHDMGTPERASERDPDSEHFHPTFTTHGATKRSAEKKTVEEWHFFYQNAWRWRNLRKITIAQVQGAVLAAGLTLAWSCDLIVGAEGTKFADPVAVRLGMCGVEYFAHPWEFGPRKAKELLLLGDTIDVEEAHRLGMVSRVFPADELEEKTLEMARRIAERPSFTSLMIKESVNQTLENQGFYNALQSAFNLHQLNHAHWAEIHGEGGDRATAEDGARPWKLTRD
ncbi:enoyl-CoA hydratase [Nocardioides zeae]|uniref:Enoyl-CoA hydratase n=1 Tax=Nocardioides imazamoxiresistens TaxID=3231893 RepID=A0ABU3PSK1_9ACTN|nr:enoyl-CoA hydratase [Nocardioides zeae]MDT9592168.1 enoyl-CoA hydratase [Nocardioides zeae]